VGLEDSRLMLIPNKKFDEEIAVINNPKIQKNQKSANFEH